MYNVLHIIDAAKLRKKIGLTNPPPDFLAFYPFEEHGDAAHADFAKDLDDIVSIIEKYEAK